MASPKILNVIVTGAARSGKATFVNSVRERERHDQAGKDADSLFGRVTLPPDLTLFLFPTPPHRALANLRQTLDDHLLGVIVLVDSTQPEMFPEVRSILHELQLPEPTPYLIAANKQDAPGAWEPDDLRIVLRAEPFSPVVSTVATDRESVKRVLLVLFNEVLKEIEQQEDTTRSMPVIDPTKPPSRKAAHTPPFKLVIQTLAYGGVYVRPFTV